MQILAYLCLSRTGLCFSGALRVQALPQPCGLLHIPCLADPDLTSPQPCVALPFRCGTSRCYSGAFHCFALPRFALTKRTVSLPCTALPTRGGTSQIVAVPALINALQFRRLSARTIACADQSLVKNCPTQPSALRGRPFAQGAGWLIMVRMRWRSASGFSVPCSTTTSS
mgnify:CR=1 FL=1